MTQSFRITEPPEVSGRVVLFEFDPQPDVWTWKKLSDQTATFNEDHPDHPNVDYIVTSEGRIDVFMNTDETNPSEAEALIDEARAAMIGIFSDALGWESEPPEGSGA